VASPASGKITKSARQDLITQIGLINSAPAGAIKVGGVKETLALLVRQMVGNPLNEIGKDPGFQVADAAAQTAAAIPAPVAPPAASEAPTPATTATPAAPAPMAQP
jgi:hypothetical protein